jgi:hypothetical protein
MIWKAKNVMKAEPVWKKLNKETRYDLLGLSDKEREYIAIARASRLDKRAKAKQKEVN